MKGNVKVYRINKQTGESDVVFEKRNQTCTGFGQAMVNVLTGTGSRKVEDYSLRYFQLGKSQYDLSTMSVSADVTASSLVPFFWTIKERLSAAEYGTDSVMSVEDHELYGLGSILPATKDITFDNFVDPPDNTKVVYDYASKFDLLPNETPLGNPNVSSIWIAGCADSWEVDPDNYGQRQLISEIDMSMSGPDGQPGVRRIKYNEDVKPPGSTCIRPGTTYVFEEDGRRPDVWHYGQKEQTASVYIAPVFYTSADAGVSAATTVVSVLQIYNRTAQAFVKPAAAQNRAEFLHRYDLDVSAVDGIPVTYTPIVYDTHTGYENNDDPDKWREAFGNSTGGAVSANVENIYGPIHTYEDTIPFAEGGNCPDGPYTCFNGPGGAYMNTSAVGFGPQQNFYRTSVTWAELDEELLTFANATVSGLVIQSMLFPNYQNLAEIVPGLDPSAGGYVPQEAVTSRWNGWGSTPRPAAHITHYQYEFNPSATPHQYIHGERPYYVTEKQSFVTIPPEATTKLVDSAVNVRLLLDEGLANGQNIQEVGLFLKNPLGNLVEDNPFLAAYKTIPCGLEKTDEYSYIIDWELAVVDVDEFYPKQTFSKCEGGIGGDEDTEEPEYEFAFAATSPESINESDNTREYRYTVELSEPNRTGVGVTVEVAQSGTAVKGTDYDMDADPLVVTIANGAQSQTFDVSVLETPDDTGNEILTLDLQNPSVGALGTKRQLNILINDDEEEGYTADFAAGEQTVDETNSTFTTPVTVVLDRTNNSGGPVLIQVSALPSSSAAKGVEWDWDEVTSLLPLEVANGSDRVSFDVSVLPTSDSVASDLEQSTAIFLLQASGTEGFDAEVGITNLVHRLKINDDDTIAGTDYSVSFTNAASTVTETDGTVTVEVTLDRPNETGKTIVAVVEPTTNSTAQIPSDYTLPGGNPTNVSIAAGATTATFSVSLTDDTEFESDELIEFEIVNAFVFLDTQGTVVNVGAQSTHEMTLQSEDADTEAVVNFTEPSDDFLEGVQHNVAWNLDKILLDTTNSDNFIVTATGGTAVPGTDFEFVFEEGVTQTFPGVADQIVRVFIPENTTTGTFKVNCLETNSDEDDKTLTLTITAVAGGQIVIGSDVVMNINIQNNDTTSPPPIGGDGAFDGWDGDDLATLGETGVPERQSYDMSDPHMTMTQDGRLILNKASSSGGWAAGTEITTDHPIFEVIRNYYYHYWMDMHGGTYTDPSDVDPLQGTKLDLVKVKVETGNTRIYDRNRFDLRAEVAAQVGGNGSPWDQGGSKINVFDDDKYSYEPSQTATLRDLVFYSDTIAKGDVTPAPWPNWYFNPNDSYYGHGQGHIDNLRFDGLNFRGGRSDTNTDAFPEGSYNRNCVGGIQQWIVGKRDYRSGQICFYDCKFSAIDNAGASFMTGNGNIKFNVRSITVYGFDMRSQPGLSYDTFQDAHEHCIYLDGLSDIPTGNHFIGLSNKPVNTINNVEQGDIPIERTFLQVENRPNLVGSPGSGSQLSVVRCNMRQIGRYKSSGDSSSGALTFQGHNGEIYIKDTVCDHENLNGGGLIVTNQGFSGGVQGGPEGTVEGRNRYNYGGPADRTFATQRLTLDGVSMINDPGVSSKTCLSLAGIEHLDIRSFNIENWNSLNAIFRLGNPGMQAGDNMFGRLDLSKFENGSNLAGYSGFPAGSKKFVWGAHMDAWHDISNFYTLTNTEINNLADLIEEIDQNRSTGVSVYTGQAGDGKYTINNPIWSHKSQPRLPESEFNDFMTRNRTISSGNSGYTAASIEGPATGYAGQTKLNVRIPMTVTGDTGSFDVEYGTMDIEAEGGGLPGEFPAWNTFLGGNLIVAPCDNNAVKESVWDDPEPEGLGMPQAPVKPAMNTNIPIRVTPNGGASSGDSVTLEVSAPEVEWPAGSGNYITTSVNTESNDPESVTFTYQP